MPSFRAVSLFSNCGAGDLGYCNAGFRFDVMAELDPRRLAVSLLNHPGAAGVPGDLRITWPQVIMQYEAIAGGEAPALLCACPPCQGMSSARSDRGHQDDMEAGSRDERNLLATVIAEVALRLKPSFVVVENVYAFLSRRVRHPEDGQPISAANYLIAMLADEYIAFPLVADLCDFGVPQSRTRAFITFVRRDLDGLHELLRVARGPYPRPTHTGEHGAPGPIALDDALTGFALPLLDASSSESAKANGYADLHAGPVWNQRTYAMVSAIPAGSGQSAWQNHACTTCGVVEVANVDATCPICGAALLRPVVQESDGSYRLVRGFRTSYRRMFPDRPAATITTASGHVGSDFTIHPRQNRLLSMLECALLQTFPPDFAWGDALQKWGSTNVREMIGEAVPPHFTQLHGEVLRGVLSDQWSLAPISLSDDRVTRAWSKLARSARKDVRTDPQQFVPYRAATRGQSGVPTEATAV